MKTVRELFFPGVDYLEKHGIEAPRRSMESLLMHRLHMERMELFMSFDKPLSEDEVAAVRADLKRRGAGEPLAYIEGKCEFLGCHLTLSPAVLIPRPETEWITDTIIHKLKKLDLSNKILLDIGTGSGCIAIALKKHLPALAVYASDISPQALEIARANAHRNGTEVHFLEGDLLAPFKGKTADFIIANLPYIGTLETISAEVSNFEPHTALYSGADGLDHYRALAREVDPMTVLWLEIGPSQGSALIELFGGGTITADYAGHPRLFSLEKALVKEVL